MRLSISVSESTFSMALVVCRAILIQCITFSFYKYSSSSGLCSFQSLFRTSLSSEKTDAIIIMIIGCLKKDKSIIERGLFVGFNGLRDHCGLACFCGLRKNGFFLRLYRRLAVCRLQLGVLGLTWVPIWIYIKEKGQYFGGVKITHIGDYKFLLMVPLLSSYHSSYNFLIWLLLTIVCPWAWKMPVLFIGTALPGSIDSKWGERYVTTASFFLMRLTGTSI